MVSVCAQSMTGEAYVLDAGVVGRGRGGGRRLPLHHAVPLRHALGLEFGDLWGALAGGDVAGLDFPLEIQTRVR